MRRSILPAVALVALLPLAACGDDESPSSPTAARTASTVRPTVPDTATEDTGLRGEGVETELTTGSGPPPATELRGPGASAVETGG